jgi:ubiquinone/menaquinone biosynthesis C-methylase UbiE
MREQLAAAVPEVAVLAGSAEELPLPDGSADAITAASAFHWFDLDRALPELHRVLRPDGGLAIVGNKRDLSDPVQQEVQAVVGRYLPTAEEIGAWRPLLEASHLFEPAGAFTTGFEQLFDAEGLAERVGTISYIARLDGEERAEVLARVREVGEAQPQPIAFRYRCEAHAYRRR